MSTVEGVPLSRVAKEISSKNAGNFFLTFDIVFGSRAVYEAVKGSGVISRELVTDLYNVPLEDVHEIVFFDPGNAIKVVVRRPLVSGDIGESDVYGAQQYDPWLDVVVPVSNDLLREEGLTVSGPYSAGARD